MHSPPPNLVAHAFSSDPATRLRLAKDDIVIVPRLRLAEDDSSYDVIEVHDRR
jgi:hypothetical protein